MSLPPKIKFDPQFAITDSSSKPTQSFRDWVTKADALLAALAAGTAPTLINAANDAAAAAAGVAIGNLYRNGSVIQVRVV